MGCDIHTMVEVRKERYSGGGYVEVTVARGAPWQAATSRWVECDDEIFLNPWFDPDSESEYFRKQPQYSSTPWDGRNYNLFALLADVRNGYGFAGVPTHDRIEPLSEPRGVPDDASFAWLAVVDGWDVDMHSHSYFTLAELEEFRDKNLLGGQMRRTGAITGTEYERLQREGGKPAEWCGSVSGGGIITVTPDEYDAGKRAPEYSEEYVLESAAQWQAGYAKREKNWDGDAQARFDQSMSVEGRTYVQYVWEDELYENAGKYVVEVIDALARYAEDKPPVGRMDHEGKPYPEDAGWYGHGKLDHNDIRVVFGFDN